MRRPSGLTRSSGLACSEGTVAAPGVPRVTDAVGSVLTAGLRECAHNRAPCPASRVVVGTDVYLPALLRTEEVPSCRLTILNGSGVPSGRCFFLFMNGYTGLSHPLKDTCTWVALSAVSGSHGPGTPHSPVVMVFWMLLLSFAGYRAALGLTGPI